MTNCEVCTSPAPFHTAYCPRQPGAFPKEEG